jgi:hypothetical protein
MVMKLMSRRIAGVAVALFVASCGGAKNDGQGGSTGRGGSGSGGALTGAGGGSGGATGGDIGGTGGASGGIGGGASGGIGGASGGIGGGASGGISGTGGGSVGGSGGGGIGGGGTGGAAGSDGTGACSPTTLCPAVYSPANTSNVCSPSVAVPCLNDVPCGAGRKLTGTPTFEDSLTCIYDGQGQLVSATTCGYRAHNTYCPKEFSCRTPNTTYCDGSPLECYHLGANVTCPVDSGSD